MKALTFALLSLFMVYGTANANNHTTNSEPAMVKTTIGFRSVVSSPKPNVVRVAVQNPEGEKFKIYVLNQRNEAIYSKTYNSTQLVEYVNISNLKGTGYRIMVERANVVSSYAIIEALGDLNPTI